MADIPNRAHKLARLKRRVVIFEIVALVLVGVLAIAMAREFVSRPFIVSGDSMVPSFQSNDYLVVDEWSYFRNTPERGDVAVFRYPLDPSIFFIKRVIGVPGDTVTISGSIVSIQPYATTTTTKLVEPYVAPKNVKVESSTITLTKDEYFMMGDNRAASFDSRVWGPVPRRYIVGKVAARLFPLQTIGLWPEAYSFVVGTSTRSTLLSTAGI